MAGHVSKFRGYALLTGDYGVVVDSKMFERGLYDFILSLSGGECPPMEGVKLALPLPYCAFIHANALCGNGNGMVRAGQSLAFQACSHIPQPGQVPPPPVPPGVRRLP